MTATDVVLADVHTFNDGLIYEWDDIYAWYETVPVE